MTRFEPTPSAQAPKPRGILKNARTVAPPPPAQPAAAQAHLHWDEHNLEEHEHEREHATRMTIDEPKTPFVHSAAVPPVEDDNFSLGAPVAGGVAPAALDERLRHVADASDPVAANTRANAGSHLTGAERSDAYRERRTSSPAADDEPAAMDQETRAKHAEFSEKRHRHYGNEAQALKLAASLAAEEDDN